MYAIKILPLLLLIIGVQAASHVSCEEYVRSYESISETIDDGQSALTEVSAATLDSARSLQPRRRYRFIISPSSGASGGHTRGAKGARHGSAPASSSPSNIIDEHRKRARKSSYFDFMRRYNNEVGGKRRGPLTSRARTVESPALSVDTGGHSSHSLASGLTRLLRIKHGHYSDIYNRIDERAPLSTKRPVEEIEESVIRAVKQIVLTR